MATLHAESPDDYEPSHEHLDRHRALWDSCLIGNPNPLELGVRMVGGVLADP